MRKMCMLSGFLSVSLAVAYMLVIGLGGNSMALLCEKAFDLLTNTQH